MESTSFIDEYSYDDFTLVKTKREKCLDKKVITKVKHNNSLAVVSESEATLDDKRKDFTISKINNFLTIPLRAKNILKQLAEEDKIKEINELREIGDNCLTVSAKINLKHQDFRHLTSEEIEIKIIPNDFYYLNVFSYNFKPHAGKSLPKFKCNGTKYFFMTEKIPPHQSVIKSSMEILNIENYVILLKKVTGRMNFKQFMENFELSSFRRREMQIELLRLIHEICGDYLFWVTEQNFNENLIYTDQWILTNLCRHSSENNMFEENLKKLGKSIGIYDFRAFVNSIFCKCQQDCLFYKTCRKIIDNEDFKY